MITREIFKAGLSPFLTYSRDNFFVFRPKTHKMGRLFDGLSESGFGKIISRALKTFNLVAGDTDGEIVMTLTLPCTQKRFNGIQ